MVCAEAALFVCGLKTNRYCVWQSHPHPPASALPSGAAIVLPTDGVSQSSTTRYRRDGARRGAACDGRRRGELGSRAAKRREPRSVSRIARRRPDRRNGHLRVDSASISFTPSATSTPAVKSYRSPHIPAASRGSVRPHQSASAASNRARPTRSRSPRRTRQGEARDRRRRFRSPHWRRGRRHPPALSGLKASLVSFFAASGGGPASPGSAPAPTSPHRQRARNQHDHRVAG